MSSHLALASAPNILIVDDNVQNLRLLSTLLSRQGYKIRKAINGESALKAIEVSLPDLILLDIDMPKMTGYQVCEHLKSSPEGTEIPVIFISASNQILDKVKAFEVGGVDYICKPFEIQEILIRVKNQLMLRQQKQQLTEQNAQLQLLLTTTQAINDSSDFRDALEVTLCQVCEKIGWDFGEVWIPNSDGTVLEYGKSRYTCDWCSKEFRCSSVTLTFAPGIGIAGTVWSSKQALWISDVSTEPVLTFHRQQLAQKFRLKACLGIPILFKEEVLAVLIFFKKEVKQPDWRLIELVNSLATQLSSLIYRKRTESTLRVLKEQAQGKAQQLEQAFATLRRTQAQLVQNEKMVSLGQLVEGIAHQLNNSTGFIYSNIDPASHYARDLLHLLELYQKYYPNPVPEISEQLKQVEPDFIAADFPQLLSSMREGANRIAQIVQSLRNFSRLDETGFKLIDIHQGLDNTLMLLQHRLQQVSKGLNIKIIKHYGQLPKVECDPGLLNQVFMSILNNAIDALEESVFTTQSSVACHQGTTTHCKTACTLQTLPISTQAPIIRICTELKHEEGYHPTETDHSYPLGVVIRIADNGFGIPKNIQPRIFDPFFTTKPLGKSKGLGLSISYQIITDTHKGQLLCHSQEGRGTEMVIELPVVQTLHR